MLILPDVKATIRKKLISRTTQCQSELFDEQTAMGEFKYNLLIKAIDKAGISLPKKLKLHLNKLIEK